MTESERKLAAILSADVVGYSRLMAEDEAATLSTLRAYREEIAMLVRQHRGRVVDTAGDNVLAEFPTALDAVRCAVEIQGVLRARNASLPAERRMDFRIGVHMGDVAVEEGRVYGDGVNIAARLEALAEAGGVCISATVREQVRNKLDVGYIDLGDQTIKNIPDQVHVYRIQPRSEPEEPARGSVSQGKRSGPLSNALVAVAALLLLLMGALWVLRGRVVEQAVQPGSEIAETASATTFVVLPFIVRGGSELEYLSEGLVSLLSMALDGAGDLHSVDPHAVLSLVNREGGGVRGLEMGRRVADRFGAGLLVLGDVIEAGSQLHLQASFYNRTQSDAIVARASSAGNSTDVSALVDDLAAQLLKGRRAGSGGRVAPLASLTTDSFEALKAYLEGESAYRDGRNEEAIAALERATSADPAFALANYLLALSHGRNLQPERSLAAAEQAAAHRERLSQRDELLVDALLAYRRGEADLAEQRYRKIAGLHPDEVEAWVYLAETLYHHNSVRGRPIREAREPLERALALRPATFVPAYHLAAIAANDGDRDALLTMSDARERDRAASVARLLGKSALAAPSETADSVDGVGREDGEKPESTAFRSETEAKDRLLADLRQASDPELASLVQWLAIGWDDLQAALRVAGILTDESRSRDSRVAGLVYRAQLELARGRWQAARAELATASALDPDTALLYRALLAASPFLDVPPADLRALQHELGDWSWGIEAATKGSTWASRRMDLRPLHPVLTPYLIGMLSARLAEPDAAEEQARAIEDLSPPGSSSLEWTLASGVRAAAALTRGEADQSLDYMERGRPNLGTMQYMRSPVHARSLERFMRAEVLREQGRLQEALAWYGTLAETLYDDVVFLAPAQRRMAEIEDQLGRPDQAVRHYTRFVELWRDCDASLRPQVDEAEQRVRSHRSIRAEP